MKTKAIQKLLLCAALPLCSCQNIHQEHETITPSVSKENFEATIQNNMQGITLITETQSSGFSTTGKQVKSYNTPNGTIQLYDIAQDSEVSQAIEELYARGDVTFGDVSFTHRRVNYDEDITMDMKGYFSPNVDVTPAVILLTKARKISEYDLYRSSCKVVERAPCGNGDSGWGARYVSDCPSCNLGKVPDPKVEGVWRNYNRVAEKRLTEDEKPRGRWRVRQNEEVSETAIITQCRGDNISKQPLLGYYYIGEKSGYSLKETKTLLLHSACSEWK